MFGMRPRRLRAWNARRGEGFRNFEDIQTQKTILTSNQKTINRIQTDFLSRSSEYFQVPEG